VVHRDIPGVLAAMSDGDVVIMSRMTPNFRTISADELRMFRVTFAARNVPLRVVARLTNRWLLGRVRFLPTDTERRLTLTMDDAHLQEVLSVLSNLGAIEVSAHGVNRR
jgi:hypothetical protein